MSARIIFKAKLLNVETGVDQKTAALTMRLVFASQRYDKGLDQIVPCSQNVKVIEDHHHMKDFYLSFKGREIYLPIEMTPVERNIFYKTTGDGKPLMLEEKKAGVQIWISVQDVGNLLLMKKIYIIMNALYLENPINQTLEIHYFV